MGAEGAQVPLEQTQRGGGQVTSGVSLQDDKPRAPRTGLPERSVHVLGSPECVLGSPG